MLLDNLYFRSYQNTIVTYKIVQKVRWSDFWVRTLWYDGLSDCNPDYSRLATDCAVSTCCLYRGHVHNICRLLHRQAAILAGQLGRIHIAHSSSKWCLQRVSIACNVERCTSYSKSVRPSVCPSVRLSVTRYVGTVSKRLVLQSCSLHWMIAPWLVSSC